MPTLNKVSQPILQMRKLRPREGKLLAKDHRATEGQRHNSDSDSLGQTPGPKNPHKNTEHLYKSRPSYYFLNMGIPW